MYTGEKRYDLIDSEMGRFLRKFTEFELLLRAIAVAVDPETTWTKASLLRTSDLLKIWVDATPLLPAEEHEVIANYQESAAEAVKIRHLVVHGRWFEVDPSRELFAVELPLTKSDARRFEPPATWPDGAHPATVMPMNPATIARAWRRTRFLVEYLNEHLESWEAHLRTGDGSAQ